MSFDVEREAPPIESIEQLVAWFRSGEKPASALRTGLEYERLLFFDADLRPVPYEPYIRRLLEALCVEHGWTPAGGPPLLALKRGEATISLEPGGQIELGTQPLRSLRQLEGELQRHRTELQSVIEPMGIRCASWGLRPFETVEQMPALPRRRYDVMRRYLPSRGRRGQGMMFLTATVQASVDFTSEADMVAKMRCAMGLSPVVAALFANSPFSAGRWLGRRTRRYANWLEVDPDRCGLLPCVFDDGFGYRAYAEWLLDVPMMFVLRHGEYLEADGMTLRRFWREGLRGEVATMADFENQVGSVFPDVRLKKVLELRAADSGPAEMALAVGALAKGLLYDPRSCRAASELVGGFTHRERLAMQIAAAQDALAGHGRGWHLGELAREVVRLAREGLLRLGDPSEADHLAPLEQIAASGETLADLAVARFGAGPFDEPTRRRIMVDGSSLPAGPG